MRRRILAAALVAVGAASAATTAALARGGEDVTIVYIEQNTGNPYFDRLAQGFKATAKSLGYELQVTGPASAGATDQIPIIQSKMQQHVDGIAIQVSDEKAETPTLKQAQAQGIH